MNCRSKYQGKSIRLFRSCTMIFSCKIILWSQVRWCLGFRLIMCYFSHISFFESFTNQATDSYFGKNIQLYSIAGNVAEMSKLWDEQEIGNIITAILSPTKVKTSINWWEKFDKKQIKCFEAKLVRWKKWENLKHSRALLKLFPVKSKIEILRFMLI